MFKMVSIIIFVSFRSKFVSFCTLAEESMGSNSCWIFVCLGLPPLVCLGVFMAKECFGEVNIAFYITE